jgi:methionyl-tRNA synthetase
MDAALDLLPADYWRYFLIANAPESDDASFTWELFSAQVNKDLADTLGNFVNRVLTFSAKRFGDQVPEGGSTGEPERLLGGQIVTLLYEYEAQLEGLQFRKAAQQLRALWSAANVYLEQKAPWLQIREDPAAAAVTLRTGMNLIYLFGLISEPVIPAAARTLQQVWDGQDVAYGSTRWPDAEAVRRLDWLVAGQPFQVPPVLFRKITDDDVAAWRERFGAEPTP